MFQKQRLSEAQNSSQAGTKRHKAERQTGNDDAASRRGCPRAKTFCVACCVAARRSGAATRRGVVAGVEPAAECAGGPPVELPPRL